MDVAPLSKELFESAGIVITDTPSEAVKVCSCKPSITVIRRGQVALERLEQSRVFQDWVDLTNALAEVQTAALTEAETNSPQGAKYRKAVAQKLRLYGFDHIHRSTRSFLLNQFRPSLEAVTAWRAQQPPKVQLELNHPRVVFNRWTRSSKPKREPPDPGDGNNDGKNTGGESDGLDQVVAWWRAAELKQREAFLADLGLIDVLTAMPKAWRKELRERTLDSFEASCSAPKTRAKIRTLRKRSAVLDLPSTPIA